jgi:hypothetical protein
VGRVAPTGVVLEGPSTWVFKPPHRSQGCGIPSFSKEGSFVFLDHPTSSFTTRPCTSVSLMLRPE